MKTEDIENKYISILVICNRKVQNYPDHVSPYINVYGLFYKLLGGCVKKTSFEEMLSKYDTVYRIRG